MKFEIRVVFEVPDTDIQKLRQHIRNFQGDDIPPRDYLRWITELPLEDSITLEECLEETGVPIKWSVE